MSIFDITTILVNYRTLDLTQLSVESFLNFYPNCNLLLVDNGSFDHSRLYIQTLAEQFQNVSCICNNRNIHHGPAIHQGIQACDTRYVFTLDSDCITYRDGFLEAMANLMEEANLYAIGSMERKNRYGFDVPLDAKSYIPYIHPHSMLLNREMYFMLPPLLHHGSPCIRNMKAALKENFLVRHFEVNEYIYHLGRGTCSRYGYGLSLVTMLQKCISYRLPQWF